MVAEQDSHGLNGANGVTVPHVNGSATYAEKNGLPAHFIGGNKLDNAPPSKVKDFVASHGGHTVITNVSLLADFSCPG
jgi:acetyl-CoA carboxylase/biotin carboxylase 1